MANIVCVTGASGFIGGHVVKQLLEKGYIVRGTVRNASDAAKTAHLRALPGAEERLQLFSANLQEPESFIEPIKGCWAVAHIASPLPSGAAADPEAEIIQPAVQGALNCLRACAQSGTVKRVVLTSSMSAVAPRPEPDVKCEEHWSDPEGQRSRESFYGASKTLAERAAWEFMKTDGDVAGFRLTTICPTMVLGPMLQLGVNATMQSVAKWLQEGMGGKCRDDSMSMVDVRDCAAQHVALIERDDVSGRYMSLKESWHWNNLDECMSELCPSRPKSEPVEKPCKPTQFDCTKQISLGVELRTIPEILADCVEEFKAKGLM